MVLLVDRSRSMDEPFYSTPTPLPALAAAHRESKGEVARRLLSEFVGRRANDLFAMVVFSTYPIQTLTWTDKDEAVQAAINAGNVGRGLAETNLGFGLERAIRLFEDRSFAGSRIIMLVSDGAATLDWTTQQHIEQLLRRYRVALYWIYLRTRNSPSIFDQPSDDASNAIAPQQALHRFFSEMGAPYRAYTAEDPRALERAIHDVSRLQTLPIHYREIRPKRSLERPFYAVAFLMMSLLVVAKLLEIRAWS
jgi:mxaC protein